MRIFKASLLVLIVSGLLVACGKSEPAAEEAAAPEPAAAEQAEPAAEEAEEAAEAPEAPAEDSFQDGVFSSPRFNVRFALPEGWEQTRSLEPRGDAEVDAGQDSIAFDGPEGTGIQMIVANTESIQLADTSFASLDDRVGFDHVNVVPERSEGRTFNGLRGYRTEGDARLRGENMPVYFIAQGVEVPGGPVMFTIFVPGDNYFENSDAMKSVLDSIEALDLRR